MLTGHFTQRVQLPGERPVSERPLRPNQIGCVTRTHGIFPRRIGDRRDAGYGGSAGYEDVLQVVTEEEDPVVAGRRDQVECIRVAVVKREPQLQVLQKDALAVVADARNHDERNIRLAGDRIRAPAHAERCADLPFADHGALGRGRAARGLRHGDPGTQGRGHHDEDRATQNVMHGEVVAFFHGKPEARCPPIVAERLLANC